MQQSFNHILTIFFRHQYFSDKQFRSLNITCEKKTSKLLRNLNIIIKSFPGGVHLLTSDPELLNTPDDSEPIRLLLNCNDAIFVNYTELPPYNPGTNLMYFNNLNKKGKGNSFLLHENEFAAQKELVQVSNGKITIPQFDPKKKYVFTDVAGYEIASQVFRQSQPNAGEFFLSPVPDGLVIFKVENKEDTKTYCYTNSVWRKPLGILEIFPGMLYNHFKEKGKLEYIINFNNRQTVWRYFLADPVFQKFNHLTIINKTKEQVFKTPKKKQIHDEMEALVFESKSKIPITELSDNIFQLVDNFDPKLKSGTPILKNLPNASPNQLYYGDINSDKNIYSHIFI